MPVGAIGCVSVIKSKVGFLNPKESENGFCVSLKDGSIQDLSDHIASGGTEESSLEVDSLVHLTHHDPKEESDLGFS